MTENSDRGRVLDYLERQLVGPHLDDHEVLAERPQRRYLTGILFPRETAGPHLQDDDIEDQTGATDTDDDVDDPVALTGHMLPSSAGISFVLRHWEPFKIRVSAGRYEPDGNAWRRRPLDTRWLTVDPPDTPTATTSGLGDLDADIVTVWRRFGSGALVTVSVVNRRVCGSDRGIDPADCLLQVRLECAANSGFAPYPTAGHLLADPEEQELAVIYRNVPTYAIGHGCAAVWNTDDTGSVTSVTTTFLPRHQLPALDFTVGGAGDVLSLELLTTIDDDPDTVFSLLDDFVDAYDAWAEKLASQGTDLPQRLRPAEGRLLKRIADARDRMRSGVRQLRTDPTIRRAFALANRAMLIQMARAKPATVRKRFDAPQPSGIDHHDRRHAWRPFQLAFLLLTIESAAHEESPDRDTVDLIWFPTGGGKTEAYLGLTAFTIFYRRLTLGDSGAGTTVITRYTLRLLTAQQFQRAATLVCACESIRRTSPEELGSRPISIGLWVGGSNSPNSYHEAVELLGKLRGREPSTVSFQIELCPWCGTEIIPKEPGMDAPWGIVAANRSFRMNCPDPSCDFHQVLPVSSVDDDIYDNPPTVLVGTVDKFAQMAWEPRSGVLLGSGPEPAPSLIIQDEFHLISGPLGTVVGIYEAAFDVVMAHHGPRPKVVASTATIRRAHEQAQGVFGRTLALFPPAGTEASDSYFVTFDPTSSGRLYAGVMPQGHTPLTAMVHLSAAMLQAPCELALQQPADDAYWTLIAYHNSLRELGKTITLAHDDIPARLKVIADAEDGVRPLRGSDVMELTSNVPPSEIQVQLERLANHRTAGAPSFVASTNMLSVGVDVPRLGMMLVVGQPKTTAEYIQATSRVGRSHPGLVVTLYSPSKPRDRSHFETFVPYHSALYRAVEPTSVTPFSIPARERALHACLVILARHAAGWNADRAAADFDPGNEVWATLVAQFVDRAAAADPAERKAVEDQVRGLQERWTQWINRATDLGMPVTYRSGGRESLRILRRFKTEGDGWPTLDSMRSVDVDVRMMVRGER